MKKQSSNLRFYNLVDVVFFSGLTVRYEAGSQIDVHFSFLWQYIALPNMLLQAKAETFIQ